MEIIGLIAEYNPFHNGHLYQIKEIKKKYPDSLIILVLNGYFTERGEISLISKENKTKIALDNDIDIVLELPSLYGTQAADIFAKKSISYLNKLHITKLVFGSESNDLKKLSEIASINTNDSASLKTYLKKGLSYPAALGKVLNVNLDFLKPNDLLAISYIKAINDINKTIKPILIKRTSDYHDLISNQDIISASNIRNKLNNHEDITKYIPAYQTNYINNINDDLLFTLLKHTILTSQELDQILGVNEGIEYRLIEKIKQANNYNEFINLVKTKRYTNNYINRLLIHILLGIKKKDNIDDDYLKILGFNSYGQNYLNKIKIDTSLNKESRVYQIELIASYIYELLTKEKTTVFDSCNKPIIK